MFYCNRGCISSRFRGNGPKHFGSHNLDLSRSRDVIDHVTNRFPIGPFLLVVYWYRRSISKRFRDIRPQKHVQAHRNTDTRWHAASDFIFRPMQFPCNVLHWTDKKIVANLYKTLVKPYFKIFTVNCIIAWSLHCTRRTTGKGAEEIYMWSFVDLSIMFVRGLHGPIYYLINDEMHK